MISKLFGIERGIGPKPRIERVKWPEEINRKIIDHTADINLTYSSIAREYLILEGLKLDQIIKTGTCNLYDKIKNIVGLSYNSRINSINEWYRQIFAESLGKNISAKNYISAYGSIDQHSQFQLFIDGPSDKHFIFFQIQNKISTIKNNRQLIDGYNLLSILETGAIKTLRQKKTLVSQITIEEKFDCIVGHRNPVKLWQLNAQSGCLTSPVVQPD